MTPHRPLSLSLLSLALGAALSAPAHAQSLLELVESARTYDTAWQSARAQLDAAGRKADQARAGLLPSAALTGGLTRSNVELSKPKIENTGTAQTVGINASQPLYRPANRITLEQGQRGVDVAQAQLDAATQKNAALVDDSSSASTGMKNQVRRLLEVIHQFRLAPDGARPAVDALEEPRQGGLPLPSTAPSALGEALPAGATPRQPQLSMAPR